MYDGHGGSKVATYVSRNLHRTILRRPEYKDGRYEDAIVAGYLECDQKMRTGVLTCRKEQNKKSNIGD